MSRDKWVGAEKHWIVDETSYPPILKGGSMIVQMSKTKLLDMIRTEHAFLETTLSQLSEAQLIQAGVHGKESVKDMLVHITAWEQRLIMWLNTAAHGEIPERPEPGATWQDMARLDERTFVENQHRPIRYVLVDFHNSFKQVLEEIETLPESDITDARRFGWTGGEPLWKVIAANTYDHYHEHAKPIRHWLSAME